MILFGPTIGNAATPTDVHLRQVDFLNVHRCVSDAALVEGSHASRFVGRQIARLRPSHRRFEHAAAQPRGGRRVVVKLPHVTHRQSSLAQT
jgi:hypothetical protein